MRRSVSVGRLLLLALLPQLAPAADTPEEHFARRIAPLLQEKCHACHGEDVARRQGGLDLRSLGTAQRGGESGRAAVVPGQPETSPLYLAVLRTHDEWSAMPPKESERLSPRQLEDLKKWIASGAVWPDEARLTVIRRTRAAQWSREDGDPVATSGGLAAEWTARKYQPAGLWAYRPVQKPAVPSTGSAAIDSLIAQRLPSGLRVAPPADRATLLRRATFDLTGLPPTPEEIEQFLADPRPDSVAFDEVVQRLLASPHYGERMAQHWLDVARYADTAGFANDYDRGNAWRYRDYVVRAFQQDLPYREFIRQQIAGDELDAKNPEFLVATGFLRMGPWELTGMEVAKVARQRFLDDVTNSVGETFLGHALQCARCHDHKFDPVPTRDYYAIQAVFATTQIAERPAPFLPTENLRGFDERRFLEQRRADHLATLAELDARLLANAEQWLQAAGLDPTRWREAVTTARRREQEANSREFVSVFNAARTELLRAKIPENQFPPKLVGFTTQEFGLERVARKGLERLKWELDRYEPIALAVYNGPTPALQSVNSPLRMPAAGGSRGELETTCILRGGDPFAQGDVVTPGVLSVLEHWPPPSNQPPLQAIIPTTVSGRRRAFAAWLADERNPLTTRVIANRIWQWHFDRPLAGNPNNFGSTGKRPTHPELLDWLAATLVESGWSIKSLHRIIMASETYRRGATHPDQQSLRDLDPTGTSYAVFPPRRLSAEELRDAMLAASGELNREVGGIPNRPEINLEAALQPRQVMGTFAAAWVPNPLPAQRQRRSLYALKIRGLAEPFREVFNSPTADFSCERRESSTVTPQVFALLNGLGPAARALALAQRVLRESNLTTVRIPDVHQREQVLRRTFLLVVGREPEDRELRLCRTHWEDLEPVQAREPWELTPWPLTVERVAVEENTGERFTFTERLHACAEFVPDVRPTEASPTTRALADVVLALWNSDAFVYVY